MNTKHHIYNIPLQQLFLPTVADTIIKNGVTTHDIIIVPGHRIQRELKFQLLKNSKQQILLLPHIMTFADICNNLVSLQHIFNNLEIMILPAADALMVDIMLANIVAKYYGKEWYSWYKTVKKFINHYYTKYFEPQREIFDGARALIYNIMIELNDILEKKGFILVSRRKLLVAKLIKKANFNTNYLGNIYIIPAITSVDYITKITKKLLPQSKLFLHGYHSSYQSIRKSFGFANDIIKDFSIENDTKNLICYDKIKHLTSLHNRLEEAKLITLMIINLINNGNKNIAIISNDMQLNKAIKSYAAIKWGLHFDESTPSDISEDTRVAAFFLLLKIIFAQEFNIIHLLELLKLANPQNQYLKIDIIYDFEINILRKHEIKNLYMLIKLANNYPSICNFIKMLIKAKDDISKLIAVYKQYFYSQEPLEDLLLDKLQEIIIYKEFKLHNKEFLVDLLRSINIRNVVNTKNFVKLITPLESRYLQFDHVIIAGCNENFFPILSYKTGNLPTSFYNDLAIGNIDQEIGFSFYDFSHAIANKNVTITRANYLNNELANESRWLSLIPGNVKLITLSPYLKAIKKLECAKTCSNGNRPIVEIELNFLPSEISAKAITLLMHNPYAYYVRYILKLIVIEQWHTDKRLLKFGILIHGVIAQMDNKYNLLADLSEYKNKFIDIFQSLAAKAKIDARDMSISWQNKVPAIAVTLFYYKQNNITDVKQTLIEKKINKSIKLSNTTNILIYARPDSINILRDNSLQIIDYKTGNIPSGIDVNSGREPQLPIEMFIMDTKDCELVYIGIKGIADNVQIKRIATDFDLTKESIINLFKRFFLKERQFFAADESSYKTVDFDHITRTQEWR